MPFNNCFYCKKNIEYYVKCVRCYEICCDNCYVYGDRGSNCSHKYDEIPKSENPNNSEPTINLNKSKDNEYVRLIKKFPKDINDTEKMDPLTDLK
jgi:hypothetical protein